VRDHQAAQRFGDEVLGDLVLLPPSRQYGASWDHKLTACESKTLPLPPPSRQLVHPGLEIYFQTSKNTSFSGFACSESVCPSRACLRADSARVPFRKSTPRCLVRCAAREYHGAQWQAGTLQDLSDLSSSAIRSSFPSGAPGVGGSGSEMPGKI
jgi:hypothetical protein